MKGNVHSHFRSRNIIFSLLVTFAIVFFVQIQDSELYEALINGDYGDYMYQKMAVSESVLYVYGFMLLLMIIQNTFTIIPLFLVISLNIATFGFLKGFLWSWFSSVVAAIIIFLTIRYLLTDRFSSKIAPELLQKIEDKGVSYVLTARVFPFIPTSFINIISGLSTITLKKFTVGTAVGNFIYFFILALIPAGLLSGTMNEYMIGVIIIILMMTAHMVSKMKEKSHNKKLIRNKG